jgi:hypothetical protein
LNHLADYMHLNTLGRKAHVEITGAEATQQAQPVQSSRIDPLRKWGWLVLAAVVAANFYYFQEMAAAIVIFVVLFIVGTIVAGLIYFVGRAGEAGISVAEPVAKRGLEAAEELSKKTFHRPRSAPAP